MLIPFLIERDAMNAQRIALSVDFAARVAADRALRDHGPRLGAARKRAYWRRHYQTAIAAMDLLSDMEPAGGVHPRILVGRN